MSQLNASSNQPLVVAHDLAKTFDVSAPWLNRVIERKPRQLLNAVDGVSFEIERGKTLALVGESGSGKSVASLSIMRLIPNPPGRIESGEILFRGRDLLKLPHAEMRKIRGKEISMIFQDPYASLNPRWRVRDIVVDGVSTVENYRAQFVRVLRRGGYAGQPTAPK